MLRERAVVLRDFLLAVEAGFARAADAVDEVLRAALDRVEPVLGDFVAAADDLVRELFARDVDLRAVDDFARERVAFAREPVALRAPLVRELPEVEADDEPVLALPSTVHFPDITRCAASATASAISEPSLVALATTLLAA